ARVNAEAVAGRGRNATARGAGHRVKVVMGVSQPKGVAHERDIEPGNRLERQVDSAVMNVLQRNIHDAGVNLTLKPIPRLNVTFMGNALWLANTHDNFYTVAGAPRGGVTATPGNGFGVNPG